jgi:GT2 family glycosyltransferase
VGYQAEKKPEKEDPNYIFLNFRFHLSQKWNRQGTHYPEPMDITNYQLTTANCSFPKSIIDVVGYFDEELKEVEDFDLGTRMIKAGYKLYYNPTIIAWHDNPEWNFSRFIERQIQYRRDDLIWLKKVEAKGILNADLRQHPRCTAGKKYGVVKNTIINMLAQPILVNLAEKKWFTIVPERLRFKMMDFVTTAFTYKHHNSGA